MEVHIKDLELNADKVFLTHKERVIRFILIGLISAAFNFLLIYVFIDLFRMNSTLLKNISNFIALILSILFAFFLHRAWTWRDCVFEKGYKLLKQLILFYSSNTLAIVIRTVSFAFFDYFFKLNYILNVAIGIGIASLLNYVVYDRAIFKR
ncbi:Putative flippase GtrA (transmembrane translocase of bactoprenol-linked glucose) [Thermodesulfobium acidiphilum]|uniref:Flippase GtrA (Transmembrane translocase of bactoprenol-linked glucose) n=1 Tax=Thermodesulfobium acidiphilum TaxID=1794699 RepID=A0A2R4W0N6_THEAF|nr:GtrA family protein [Thermodesulfobium acidiphilum]AWB10369.1 Putative flippase GtrA (transmembrane translocase of bactoprenol-linked glucose) [Thermodesulfobium acidiphilum]